MALSNAVKKQFRAIGHNLHPIVSIAQKGLSENIKLELARALSDHELIKIKLLAEDRTARRNLPRLSARIFKPSVCKASDTRFYCIEGQRNTKAGYPISNASLAKPT